MTDNEVVQANESGLRFVAQISRVGPSDSLKETASAREDFVMALLRSLSLVALLITPCANAAVVFVDAGAVGADDGTSWTNAFVHLTDAILNASAFDEIWVADGIYWPDETSFPQSPMAPTPNSRSATFAINKPLILYGGFDGGESSLLDRAGYYSRTILSGDIQQNDGPGGVGSAENSFHVVSVSASLCVLDGFTIRGGNDQGLKRGGAGLLVSGATFTLRNTTLKDCTSIIEIGPFGSPATGGGAMILGGVGPHTVTNCSFYDNVVLSGSDRNADGGAVAIIPGPATFTNCVFRSNRAIDFWSSVASRGGAIFGYPGAVITAQNCVFAFNTAQSSGVPSGGAIFASDLEMRNCTVYGNTTPNHPSGSAGAGGVVASNSATLANSILWKNRSGSLAGPVVPLVSEQMSLPAGSTVTYCCVQGLLNPANGNTGKNPNLADPNGADDVDGTADDDLRLSASSPLIDAANNASLPLDVDDLDGDGITTEPLPVDLDGRSRAFEIFGSLNTGAGIAPIADMGAYEFHGAVCQEDLGFGDTGVVSLEICGDDLTVAGGVATAQVAGTPPLSSVLLIASLTLQPSVVGGLTLAPGPPFVLIPLSSNSQGYVLLALPGSSSPPVTVYVQALSVAGNTVSNAVELVIGS